MPDILIRDLPDDVLAAIDARARRVGLSRTAYIRRILSRERDDDAAPHVSVEHLVAFADTFTDLADADVMRQAWS
ncbi:MAG: type II toxin-antitoxin system VapB family antitoxin [Acidimicrobiales bacterium]